MAALNRRRRQRGAVLATGLFLLTMLAVFLLGLTRAASWSLVSGTAASARDRAFQAADDALNDAVRAATFDRDAAAPVVSHPAPGVTVTLALDYLGETVVLPHAAWDPVRDADLRAHHFRVRAAADAPPARRTLERDFALVAPAGIGTGVSLSAAATPANAPFGGALIPGPWRAY